jgi:hypothetical protein
MKHHGMKAYGGAHMQIHGFLTSTLVGGGWSALRPGRFHLRGKSRRYPLERRLAGHQTWSGQRGHNSWPYRDSNPDPSVVQSLYPLRYPGSRIATTGWIQTALLLTNTFFRLMTPCSSEKFGVLDEHIASICLATKQQDQVSYLAHSSTP